MKHTLLRRTLAVAAIAVLPQLAAVGAGAQAIAPVTVTGQVACDQATGNQVVTWTLTNNLQSTIDVFAATIDGSGMVTPGPIDTTASFSPTSLTFGATATATTRVTGNGTGDLHITVELEENGDPFTADGEVVMPGNCVQVTTTTTSTTSTTSTTIATTTTTAPAPTAVAAVVVTPAYTG